MGSLQPVHGSHGEAAGRLHVDLTVDVDAEPIAGRLRADTGEEESFTGWLGLAAALEALAASRRREGCP